MRWLNILRREIRNTLDDEGGAASQEKRNQPKSRFLDVLKEDKQLVAVTEGDAEVRVRWKPVTHRGDPYGAS